MPGPLISIVVTVLNEAKHLRDLLESLVVQEAPYEVLVVDAGSRDGTQAIAQKFQDDYPAFRLLVHPGSRGESRNFGVDQAKGDYVAFIDGDCIANAFWLRDLRAQAGSSRVVAGRTTQIGYWAFERLERVELRRRGYDISAPSCNLLYPRTEFQKLAGFDPRFITAEDIDLNFRAVEAGVEMRHATDAVVYHRARDSIMSFLQQAYWNGYGRKQLTLKHGSLWATYSFRHMLQGQLSPWGLARLSAAILGYLNCKLRERPKDWQPTSMAAVRQVAA